MGAAGAEVVAKKIKQKGIAMGVHRQGLTVESIKTKEPFRSRTGIATVISPIGSRKSGRKIVRNGEVAFINNYGKKGQAGRPFFTQGIAESENEAIEKAEKVYEKYLNTKNL